MQDYYPPVNRVILKSSLVPETPLADPDLSNRSEWRWIARCRDRTIQHKQIQKLMLMGQIKINQQKQTEIDEETGLPDGS